MRPSAPAPLLVEGALERRGYFLRRGVGCPETLENTVAAAPAPLIKGSTVGSRSVPREGRWEPSTSPKVGRWGPGVPPKGGP